MSNYKFKLLIKPEEIYNNLYPEQKKQFNNVQIIKAVLFDNGELEIECLALESEVKKTPYLQIVEFPKDEYITIKNI